MQRQGFEYGEHECIADTTTLKIPNSQSSVGKKYPFTLPSGLNVIYGKINRPAGNFHRNTFPISDGPTAKDHGDRFQAAYKTLAQNQARQVDKGQQDSGNASK